MTNIPLHVLVNRKDELVLSSTHQEPTFKLSQVAKEYQKLLVAALMHGKMSASTVFDIAASMASMRFINLGTYFSEEILTAVGLFSGTQAWNMSTRLPDHIGLYRWISANRGRGWMALELLEAQVTDPQTH